MLLAFYVGDINQIQHSVLICSSLLRSNTSLPVFIFPSRENSTTKIEMKNKIAKRKELFTMFLASVHILRPVAAVSIFIVQQTTDTQLLCRRSIPTCPISGTRRFMTEYAVQPVAMLCRNGTIYGKEAKKRFR